MKRFVMMGLAAALAAPAPAQTPRVQPVMDYADIFRLANLGGAELSPDGAWVVYEASKLQFPDWQRRTDLYVVSADGRTTRQLTYTEGEDETGARWQPRAMTIGFTSTRDNKKRQLFLIRPDGGEARRITNHDEGIGAWAWSRDGAWIAYLAGPEGKRQIWVLPGDGSGKAEQLTKHATSVESFVWSEPAGGGGSRTLYFTAADESDSTRRRRMKDKFDVRVMNEPTPAVHLWSFDLIGKTEKRLTQGDFRVSGVELSKDGRWAAFRGRPTDRYGDDRATELYLVNLESGGGGGATDRLTNNYVGEGAVRFSPDSRLIAFTADRDFTWGNLSRVYVRPVTGGTWRELGKGDAHDVGLGFWSADSRTIYWNGDEGVNGSVYALDVATGAVRSLGTRMEAVVTAAKAEGRETALLRYADPRSPTDLYLAPVAQLGRREGWIRLTRLNPWVDSLSLGKYEAVRWKAGDGTTVEGILVYPVGWDRTRRYPLIVQLHGGPAAAYQNGFSGSYGTYTHVLAGKGYAVFQPNYRGSTGYGEAFQAVISGNYWPLAAEDILAGVDTLVARGIAAPDSLGMMGWSAGGHWSNWTLVTTDRFKAISSGAGVSNWISLYAQTDVQATRQYYLGGDATRTGPNKPWDNFDHWWAESPLRYITRARTPTLLHSGEKDERIPMAQNLEMHMALKQRGVPTEFFVYPGQPHGLQEPRYQLTKMVAEVAWFERWIRGKPGFTWEELLATADRIAGKEGVSRQAPAVSRSGLAALALPLAAQQHQHGPADGHQVGRVVFPTSCNAAAQPLFERAMAMLHSFWWEQGPAAFGAVTAADSTCALAYWGLALNYWGNPFAGGASGENLRRGAAAAARAVALGAPTARERGLLAAVTALYRDVETVPNPPRLQAYSDTLARLARDYADDPEIVMYYAMSLVATASATDTTFARQKRAAAILNPLFRTHPAHPGLAHYIIHANDSPRLAHLGLDAARRYAQIAPSAPHAQHMPSHIFIRLGLWDETIAANQRSFQAGVDYAQAHRLGGIVPEQFHALDYMVYGYLQQGRDSAARATVADGLARAAVLANDALLANYNRVAMEARIPLERGDWAGAARLPVRATQPGIGAALAHFARGVGAVRNGDTAQARAEVAALAAIEAALQGQPGYNWSRIVGIRKQAVAAWLALAAGDTTGALREARAAADLEDVTEKHPVTPGELLPARELYADLLLATGRYGAARAAYDATLTREPGRARSIYGAGRAAEMAGDRAAARARYGEFLKVMERADGDRPELAIARKGID